MRPKTICEAIELLKTIERHYGDVDLPEGTGIALEAFEDWADGEHEELAECDFCQERVPESTIQSTLTGHYCSSDCIVEAQREADEWREHERQESRSDLFI